MHRFAIASLAAITALAGLAYPRQADACSFPPPIQIDEDLTVPLTNIPTSGVVPIYVHALPEEVEPGYPIMTVLDDGDSEVSGTIDLGPNRLVWRASAALLPDSTYAATLELSSWDVVTFSFTTAAGADTPALELTPGDIHLEEISHATERICCDPVINSCGGQDYEHCWAQAADYLPFLTVNFEADQDAARFYQFDVETPGAGRSSSGVSPKYGSTAWAAFYDRLDDYCITLRARPLTGGADVERTVCQSDAALVELPPFVPEEPDASQCDEAPVDPATGVEADLGGCAAGPGSQPGTWWLLLGVAFALSARSRRGRRPGCRGRPPAPAARW